MPGTVRCRPRRAPPAAPALQGAPAVRVDAPAVMAPVVPAAPTGDPANAAACLAVAALVPPRAARAAPPSP